jgi:hypothetical protein
MFLQESFELVSVSDFSEIDCCQVFKVWLYDFHEGVEGAFLVVQCQEEINLTSCGKTSFGDLNGLDLIGHKHETRAENDHIELFVGVIFFKVVEVHVFDFDIFVFREEFLAGRNIIVININTQNFGVFETMNDAFQGVSGRSSNVEYFLDRTGGCLSSFTNCSISSSGFK